MNSRTAIVVCYKAGTTDILRVWILSVFLHTEAVKVFIVTADEESFKEAQGVLRDFEGSENCFEVVQVNVAGDVPKTRIHGAMLDCFVASSSYATEFTLTMDSDCFPVDEGWLESLEGMMDRGAKVAGILHPWAPPPEDMDHKKLAWRVRSQHCWERTHVACQMIRTEDLKLLMSLPEIKVTFAGGDDTGLAIPNAALKMGWKIDGFKVTRCAKPRDGSDPEFNRFVCLVFGDKVYHHGGFTRIATQGDKPMMEEAYGWVKSKILSLGGAEFLLSDEYSYRFKFDREEEVAEDKIDRLFGAKTMSRK